MFARDTGYIGNMLPKHLARLGAEVHMVSMDLPPYYQIQDFHKTYADFTGADALVPGAVEALDGFTLHVLGHRRQLGYMRFIGLAEKLRGLRPDVVQAFAPIGWIALDAAWLQLRLGYKLFTGCHTTASVFPPARERMPWHHPQRLTALVKRALPGWLAATRTVKCYGATRDCAEVAVQFFGVPRRKIDVCELGVDTEIFHPCRRDADREARESLRSRHGVAEEEILCIYSGRFAEDKNPLLLARAVERLRGAGEPFRGLFVGNGVQSEAIAATPGCAVHPFVPVGELGGFFRAADIGVWPTQESTSMLDAAACGLPIVVNDTLQAVERVEGNGLRYRLNDLDDLVRALRELRDPERRRGLGEHGARKMAGEFSWAGIARRRLRDYEAALEIQS